MNRASRSYEQALFIVLEAVHTAFGLDSEDGEAIVYAGTGR